MIELLKTSKDKRKIGTVIKVYPGKGLTIRICDVRIEDTTEILKRRAV